MYRFYIFCSPDKDAKRWSASLGTLPPMLTQPWRDPCQQTSIHSPAITFGFDPLVLPDLTLWLIISDIGTLPITKYTHISSACMSCSAHSFSCPPPPFPCSIWPKDNSRVHKNAVGEKHDDLAPNINLWASTSKCTGSYTLFSNQQVWETMKEVIFIQWLLTFVGARMNVFTMFKRLLSTTKQILPRARMKAKETPVQEFIE